ncbi:MULTISPECIES: MFS transporter [Streptomyces]|jgi:DHA2 family multidrug resistance protein-like MFS transporter|uniref:Transmembrane transport protein n=3 Tax=Streptomyces griseoaurantiacus TaxID=68213 RepID=F3NLP6_9ACTN|nr:MULTISPECIES: MFS transporter [Streptomyces]EGG45972.1 transmembrane transport protein [Streptomyces griseoaurantiacus M045]MBA5221289.1 MFS transporter [Streptomyces griseoaurantiacus]MDX3088015.1 MFS transporter [Streptomyces sp. ME12-02E]MDX3331372.1 MFS transporter [Streptomyces sp. ME02-6978a]MDX3360290.1 MFS transporter [Streptomyces sp. ME02-6978.2a]
MSGTTTAAVRSRREPGAGANRWIVLVVLCVSLLLVAVDATVLHVAVPAVTEDLRPGAIELLWIVDVYPLVCASLLILFGTLGDRIGRRRVLLLGYALFGLASALAAFAGDAHMLIGARALLGVGGAMIMPATLSLLRQVFPDRRERALAIGVWSAVAAVGAAVGPLLGGFLLEHFWWGSVFLVNIPLMLVSLPVGRALLPESRGDGNGPWDVTGACMAAAGLFGSVFGVKRLGGGEPPLSVLTLVPLLAGALLLVLFVRRQRRRKHPLVDLGMFARKTFSTSVGCIVLAMLALVGLELIAAQYLQLVLGLSPLETGLRLLPLTFAAMAAGLLGSRLLQRFGPRRTVAFGFLLTAGAVLTLTVMGAQDEPPLLLGAFLLLGFGLETTLFGAYESMLSEAPAEQAGGAAAIGETSYQLGAGIGIALLGSVMNAAYAPGLASVPGVPAGASAAAGHSLGEAYAVAGRLGGERGELLRQAARHSFVQGLHVTLLVSAGLLLAGAVMALRLPRVMQCVDPEQDAAAEKPVQGGAVPAPRAVERSSRVSA